MGKISTLRVNAVVTRAKEPEHENHEELQALRERAEAFGMKLQERKTSTAERFREVEAWFEERRSDLGWLMGVANKGVQEAEETGELQLVEHESGKAYRLFSDLNELCAFLKSKDLLLNGVIYREGEEIGDLQRITIKDSSIVGDHQAKLIFDDGEIYS